MRVTTAWLCLATFAISACGSGDDGNTGQNENTGGAASVSLGVTSLASMTGPISGRSRAVTTDVVITDLADTCGAFVEGRKLNNERASSTATTLTFGLNDSRDLEAGTYAINYRYGREAPLTGRFATAAITTADAACAKVFTSATQGEIEVESVDDTGLTGTFSVSFDDGTSLNGTFDAPACPEFLETTPDGDAPEVTACVAHDD